MAQWKLWFVHLLPLCLCSDIEVTRVRTTGREPYVVPLCSTESLRKDSLILCRVSREMRGGEDCFMTYQHRKDFGSECGSRFIIMPMNHTVYLRLTSLTPEDSGNYTCRCPFPKGSDFLFLQMTVEEPSNSSRNLLIATTVISLAFVIGTGLVIGRILRKKYCRDDTSSAASTRETCFTSGQGDQDDPYTSLRQPAGDFYQIMSSVQHQHDNKRYSDNSDEATAHLDDQEVDWSETDANWEVYENI